MDIFTGILLCITGIGMKGFWLMHIIKGGLPNGIRSKENGGFLAFHISAELIAALFCIVSGIALMAQAGWRYPVALVAVGMLFYTSLNSLAWGEVPKNPKLSIMFIIPAVISVYSIIYLLIQL